MSLSELNRVKELKTKIALLLRIYADLALAESFFGNFKSSEIRKRIYQKRTEAKSYMVDLIMDY
jgi:hypothetical protein